MVMPQMGESITEATILKWLKQPGEAVEKDEVILEISTDKVDSEIPAPAAGIITELLFKEGDVVPVKQKIATIDSAASAGQTATPTQPPSAQATPIQSPPPQVDPPQVQAHQHASTHTNGNGANHSAQNDTDKFFSPLVKGLAQQHGISLSELAGLSGSGHAGRITKEDFYSYVDTRSGGSGVQMSTGGMSMAGATSAAVTPAAPVAHTPAPIAAPAAAPTQQTNQAPAATSKGSSSQTRTETPSANWSGDGTKVVVMDNMRQAIADHMVMSKKTSPHVYSVTEVDVTNIAKWRVKNQKEFLDKEGVKLSFTPFFLEAAVRALVQFPEVNASIDGKKIIMKKNVNLGCAVALGTKGLIVPVIKRAEEKNFVGIARTLNELAERARTKKLSPDDVREGTFTVTNPGVFGTIIGYPIINQPQLAILSLGAIKKRPMVINDAIAIRDMCYLTLSYDHRVVDGSLGGSFLAFIRDYLENWDINKPLY